MMTSSQDGLLMIWYVVHDVFSAGSPRLQDPPQDRDHAEKLQSELIMMRAALTAAGLVSKPQVLPHSTEPEMPTAARAARVYGRGKSKQRQQQQQKEEEEQPPGKTSLGSGGTKGAAAAAAAGRAASGKRRRQRQQQSDDDDDDDDDGGGGGKRGEVGRQKAAKPEDREEGMEQGQQLVKRASISKRSGPGTAGRAGGKKHGAARGGRGAGGRKGKLQRVGKGTAAEEATEGEDAEEEDEAAADGEAAASAAAVSTAISGQGKRPSRGKGSRH